MYHVQLRHTELKSKLEQEYYKITCDIWNKQESLKLVWELSYKTCHTFVDTADLIIIFSTRLAVWEGCYKPIISLLQHVLLPIIIANILQ